MHVDELAGRPGHRPLLPDEVARMADLPANEEVPEDVAARLGETRLHIAGASPSELEELLRRSDTNGDGIDLVLPAGAVVGRAGRTGERLERAAHDLPERGHTLPMRPPWAPQTYQPHVAGPAAARPPMRRIQGKRMEPYYGVYGPDDRQVFWPGPYPWRCVGRIFTWTNWASGGGWNWSGSGVLVGARHVVTAGHVCPWGSSSWAMLFVPAYWDGTSVYGAGAQSWTSDFRGWNTNDTVAAHDMAVLRLYDPLGPWLGWMGTKVYDSSWDGGPYWTLAGYPGAIAGAQRPSSQSGIPVLDNDDDGDAQELEHHGDATAGDSGGPFFGFWNDGPYAVGTTSGGEAISGTLFGWGDEDNNIEAGGRALVDLVLWAQENWP
jgi:hypothetical protein